MITYDSGLEIFYSTKINDTKFISGFGTKAMGDARAFSNVVNYFTQNSIDYKTLVTLEQIHSANVALFENANVLNPVEKIGETDGVITPLSQTILTIQTADCVPMIFVDKEAGLIGISHQGWRGSLKRLPQKMVDRLVASGAKKEKIVCAIGPSINNCCYNIDEDRYLEFLMEFDGYNDKIFYKRGDNHYLSLPHLNYLLLREAGIQPPNIDYFPFCTSCNSDRFFSFRRDKNKEYGQMLSFINHL